MSTASAPVLEWSAIEPLVRRVCDEYDVEPGLVHQYAAEVFAQFRDVRLRSFVPLLVEKQLRDKLRHGHMRRAVDPSPNHPPATGERSR